MTLRPLARSPILVVLGLFLALGLVYDTLDPVFEASDEISHYPVVQYIATGQGLPVQDPKREQLWRQEGSQPPLYYMLAALATSWIDTSDMLQRLWYNPHSLIGLPLEIDNKNMVIHTARERFPYRRTVLAVHLIRWLSLLMGASTIYLTYLIAQEAFLGRKELALASASLAAFNPMFLFISASVNNDNLAILLSSLTTLLMLRIGKGEDCRKYLAGLALVLGLAALTKLSCLGLIPLAYMVLAIRAWKRRSVRFLLGWGMAMLLAIAIISGWWYVRNLQLYGDPSGLSAMLAIAHRRERIPSLRELSVEFEGFRINYWGLFGGVNVLADAIAYKVFDAIFLTAGVGLALGLLRQRGKSMGQVNWMPVLLLAWIGILFVALIRWTRATYASQGRLMFPAISAISILLSRGLEELAGRRLSRYALGATTGFCLLVAAISPFRYIAPAYAPPRLLSAEELLRVPNRVDVSFEDKVKLVGYELNRRALAPGESFHIKLCWQCLAEMDENYSIFIHIYDREGPPVAQRDTYPGQGKYPTSLWRAGDGLCDTYQMHLPFQVKAPVAARLVVGLYRLRDFSRLQPYDGQGRPIEGLQLTRIKLAPRKWPHYTLREPADFLLGGKVALKGYELETRELRAGDMLRLKLLWQDLAEMDLDYTVFVHVIDSKDKIWAQKDQQPLAGEYPTSFWAPGEVILDEHVVHLGPDLPAGEYLVEVGMYYWKTGERLKVRGPSGPEPGDRMLLGRIKVG